MPRAPRRASSLALVGLLLALSTTPVLSTTPAQAASPPRFPIPASALPHGGATTTTGVATTSAGTATTPAAGATTPTSTAPAVTTPGSATTPATPTGAGILTPTRPALVHHAPTKGTSLSMGAIVAAALAALLILLCLLWSAARWYAYEPRWILPARHAIGEAGMRMSATWEEFGDWLRLGR